jgi:TctA family transporter
MANILIIFKSYKKLLQNLILPLVLGTIAIMDGMLRTSMITSQAHGAILAPLRLALYLYIMYRTALLAQATRHTSICGMERLGRHQELSEQAS